MNSETQEYCEHDEDHGSFQSSIHQFCLKNKNIISILNIILEYNIRQVVRGKPKASNAMCMTGETPKL